MFLDCFDIEFEEISVLHFRRSSHIKSWTHHEQKYVYDVSKLYLLDFTGSKRPKNLKNPYKSRITCLPLR